MAFRRTPGGGLATEGQSLRLSPTFSVADLIGNNHSMSTRVMQLLVAAFAPMAYLEDVTSEILLRDDQEREKLAKDDKAMPLTEKQRVIVEYLNENFGAWVDAHLSIDDNRNSEDVSALEIAEAITRLALKHRMRTDVNSETAEWLIYFLRHGREAHDTALSIKDLGIGDVGPERARLLAQAHPSVDALYSASEEDLEAVNGIGPITAAKIVKGLMESKPRPSEIDDSPNPSHL
jgi:hypothetical protein